VAKTKLQSVGSDSGPDLLNVVVDGNPVDLVESFTYLRSIQTSDGYCRSDITIRIGLSSSAVSSLSNIWNTKHLPIQTKVRVYQTPVLSILLYVSETWTSLASDMRAIESFHMKCQRRILGIRWHDLVRNSEVSLRTCLAPDSDRITRGRNAIFRHVARLPGNTSAHQAMLRQVELSVGRPQTLHGNINEVDHVPNGPTNSAAITTMFPLLLCGGKALVAVTRERRYGPSRLRVTDDDDDDHFISPPSAAQPGGLQGGRFFLGHSVSVPR